MESWWLTLKSDVGDPQLTVYIPPACTGKLLWAMTERRGQSLSYRQKQRAVA